MKAVVCAQCVVSKVRSAASVWTTRSSPIATTRRSDDVYMSKRHVESRASKPAKCLGGGSADPHGAIGQDSRIPGATVRAERLKHHQILASCFTIFGSSTPPKRVLVHRTGRCRGEVQKEAAALSMMCDKDVDESVARREGRNIEKVMAARDCDVHVSSRLYVSPFEAISCIHSRTCCSDSQDQPILRPSPNPSKRSARPPKRLPIRSLARSCTTVSGLSVPPTQLQLEALLGSPSPMYFDLPG